MLEVCWITVGVSAKKKGRRGTGGIVLGVLSLILVLAIAFSFVSLLTTVQDRVKAQGDQYPLLAKSLSNPALGFAGMIANMSQLGEANLEQLRLELDSITSNSTGTAN